VHVEPLENTTPIGCRRRALDDDIVSFAQHHADHLDERCTLQDGLGYVDTGVAGARSEGGKASTVVGQHVLGDLCPARARQRGQHARQLAGT
jgi:hypothetical protein